MDQLIERVRAKTTPEGAGVFATWEACFRMAFRGECDIETVLAKFAALKPYLPNKL